MFIYFSGKGRNILEKIMNDTLKGYIYTNFFQIVNFTVSLKAFLQVSVLTTSWLTSLRGFVCTVGGGFVCTVGGGLSKNLDGSVSPQPLYNIM